MFEKMTKDRNFYLFWGPKSPQNWASDAHIVHTSKSTCNEYMRQHWCDFWLIWRPKMAPNFGPRRVYLLHTYKSSSYELANEVSREPSKKNHENRRKPIYWPILALFGTKNGPKIWPTRGNFSRTPQSIHNIPVNEVSWSRIKNLLRKWLKTSQIPILPIFIARSIKHRSKHWKKGAYSIWKKVDGRTDDGRLGIG